MPDRIAPLQALVAAFLIAAFGGLAALLRSQHPITLRSALAAILYSGLLGLVIALLWYNYFDGQGNIFFLLGVSGLSGIGGATLADFLVQLLKQGGIQVFVMPQHDPALLPPATPPSSSVTNPNRPAAGSGGSHGQPAGGNP